MVLQSRSKYSPRLGQCTVTSPMVTNHGGGTYTGPDFPHCQLRQRYRCSCTPCLSRVFTMTSAVSMVKTGAWKMLLRLLMLSSTLLISPFLITLRSALLINFITHRLYFCGYKKDDHPSHELSNFWSTICTSSSRLIITLQKSRICTWSKDQYANE